MQYKRTNSADISFFNSVLGVENVKTDADTTSEYGRDYTEDLEFPPEVVLFPENAQQISQIMQYCNEALIPVTPRGAGTGLSGGSLPVYGGVSLSTSKLDKIISIDTENFMATVEPGVINENLRMAVAEKGLYYPPDPASKGSCFLGGNIAHSSGGPKAVKYGTTKDYVLNLELVLPDGSIIWTGANTLKNATGYNLTQLVVGSEGTLGIVTKIVFRLISLPLFNKLIWASFADADSACRCVPAIMSKGITPSAMEYMDRKGIEITCEKLGIPFQFGMEQAYLLIEVEGNNRELLDSECESIYEQLEKHQCLDALLADTAEQKEHFWKIRRSIGETVKSFSVYKEEDTVVTRSYLPLLYQKIKELEAEYGFVSVCYGHAGDGNLHVNILKMDMENEKWEYEIPKAIRKLFEACKQMGGTISGEHGIGLVQKNYLDVVFTDTHFKLMKGIKQVFDPKNILNPGKTVA